MSSNGAAPRWGSLGSERRGGPSGPYSRSEKQADTAATCASKQMARRKRRRGPPDDAAISPFYRQSCLQHTVTHLPDRTGLGTPRFSYQPELREEGPAVGRANAAAHTHTHTHTHIDRTGLISGGARTPPPQPTARRRGPSPISRGCVPTGTPATALTPAQPSHQLGNVGGGARQILGARPNLVQAHRRASGFRSSRPQAAAASTRRARRGSFFFSRAAAPAHTRSTDRRTRVEAQQGPPAVGARPPPPRPPPHSSRYRLHRVVDHAGGRPTSEPAGSAQGVKKGVEWWQTAASLRPLAHTHARSPPRTLTRTHTHAAPPHARPVHTDQLRRAAQRRGPGVSVLVYRPFPALPVPHLRRPLSPTPPPPTRRLLPCPPLLIPCSAAAAALGRSPPTTGV